MRKTLIPKIALLTLFAVSTLFFSNDFGLIDIEKTAIITAIAIDKADDGDYLVTCQIAVPEATGAVSENQKAQIAGKGNTVGNAIKSMGSVSGWFPQTIFCNLIIVGNELSSQNVVTVLDYFSKTMRVQDSAQVILAEEKAKDLLNATTPLDNISSFAIQKILLKNPGFDQDVAPTDIKTFCVGYYSDNHSSFMPMVKVISADDGTSESSNKEGKTTSENQEPGGQQGQEQSNAATKTQGKSVFDATTTALFVNGVKVGELDKNLTHTFNMLTKKINGSAFAVSQINGANYLLTVLNDKSSVKVIADEKDLTVKINVCLYCKISDQNAIEEDSTFEKNIPLPSAVKTQTEQTITQSIQDLFQTSRQTGCDFLKIKEKLYRFNHKQYSRYKDNYLQSAKVEISVTVNGQL